jgi:hypothetical protein
MLDFPAFGFIESRIGVGAAGRRETPKNQKLKEGRLK